MILKVFKEEGRISPSMVTTGILLGHEIGKRMLLGLPASDEIVEKCAANIKLA
jgi:hypothetical protein